MTTYPIPLTISELMVLSEHYRNEIGAYFKRVTSDGEVTEELDSKMKNTMTRCSEINNALSALVKGMAAVQ